MSRTRLASVLVAALVVPLVVAAPGSPSRRAGSAARQATTPELIVVPFVSALGRGNANNGLEIVVPANQPSPARAAVFAPGGYNIDLALAPGTVVGTADARVTTTAGQVTVRGNITVDSPARLAGDPAAIACAGAGPHRALWIAQLTAGTTTLSVPVFIDATTGTEAALGVFKLQVCLPASDVPPGGVRVTDLFLDVTRGISNPAEIGVYLWRLFLTPYVPGTTTLNPAATSEARSLVPLPQVLTLTGRYDKKTKSIVLAGSIALAGQRFPQIDVEIWGSTKRTINTFKRLKSVKTKTKKGTYSHKRKSSKTMYFFTVVDEFFTGAPCESGPSSAPAGCVQENVSLEAFSRLVTVKVPTKKK